MVRDDCTEKGRLTPSPVELGGIGDKEQLQGMVKNSLEAILGTGELGYHEPPNLVGMNVCS